MKSIEYRYSHRKEAYWFSVWSGSYGPGSRGFGWIKVRDSGNVNGIRNLTATWEGEFAKIWARMWGKNTLFDIAMTEARDARFSWKTSGNVDQYPLSRPY